jgi:hypothetical protein
VFNFDAFLNYMYISILENKCLLGSAHKQRPVIVIQPSEKKERMFLRTLLAIEVYWIGENLTQLAKLGWVSGALFRVYSICIYCSPSLI